jgi:tetratricopeptide (TPR) repeat protein
MIRIPRYFFLVVLFLTVFFSHSTVFSQAIEQSTFLRFMKTGMEQLQSRNYRSARDSFEQAVRYNDASAAAHVGLGVAHFHLRNDREAEQELTRAAEIDPRDGAAYQFLGELYYRKDDLDTAATYWEKAVELNPSESELRARLERIRKEHKTEKDFNRDVTSHFLTKYEGRERIEAGKIVLRILEDAYGEVGRALSYYPDHEIQVILYSGQQFQEVTDAPGWSGGVFDGKIRMPIGGIDKETPGLRRILYHEYTHAVVRAITPRCPTWLNEGLAQHFEGRTIDSRQKDALRQIAQEGKLPSLTNLEGSFMGLGGNQAAFAYLLSLSSVSYMIDSGGLYRIKSVLEELGRGADTNQALSTGMMLSYEELNRGWKRSLE